MKKNFKRLSAAAFAGVIGLGLAGSPVMAANPSEDTQVFYTTDSTSVDAEGKIVMIVPASVNLNGANPEKEFEVIMQTSDTNQTLPTDFKATVEVDSKNDGLLKVGDTVIQGEYDLFLKGPKGDGTDNTEISLTNPTPLEQFVYKDETKNKSSKTLIADASAGKDVFENQAPGTLFTDTLTFTVTHLEGTGLKTNHLVKPQP